MKEIGFEPMMNLSINLQSTTLTTQSFFHY